MGGDLPVLRLGEDGKNDAIVWGTLFSVFVISRCFESGRVLRCTLF